MRSLKVWGPVVLAMLLAACGSSNNTPTTASLRFVNAAHSSALSMTLNTTAQFSNLAAGTGTGYAAVAAGNYTVSVSSPSGTLTSSASQTFSLGSGQAYTLLAYERNGAIVVGLLTEYQALPPAGYATVGVENVSPDAGTLDVYVVAPGLSLTNQTPAYQFAQYGAGITSKTVAAGTYDIVATATGNPNDIRSRLSSVALASGQILLLTYSSTSGGALVDAEELNQGGTVQVLPTASARARIISALPSSPATAVGASVGTSTLTPVYSLPLQGSYALVPGGSTSYTVTVGSNAATLQTATFAAGGDYTILAYGTAATAAVAASACVTGSTCVTVLTDNNQTPLGSNVNLRLVNVAANNASSAATLYDNNIQVAGSVAYGMASPYLGVAASSASSVLTVIEPTAASSATPEALGTIGAVYTVFVNDTSATPAVLVPDLTRDR